MHIPPVVWIVLVGIIFAITVLVWGAYARRRRIEQLQAAADDLGLAFFVDGDPGLVNELGCFELFSQGRNRHITNMIYGDAGDIKVGIFDYQVYNRTWQTEAYLARNRVAYVYSPALKLPDFTLRPENVFHKIRKHARLRRYRL